MFIYAISGNNIGICIFVNIYAFIIRLYLESNLLFMPARYE